MVVQREMAAGTEAAFRPNDSYEASGGSTERPDATKASRVTHMDRRISSPRSFSSRRSTSVSDDSYSEDGPSHSSSSPQSRPCNRYGWFVDSEEAQQEEEAISPERLRSRELKWIEMTSEEKKWFKYVNKKFKVLRSRCRKGIPHAVRGRAWFYLCGGHKSLQRQPELFEQLTQLQGNEQVNEEITKDLHRQFPSHEIFASKGGTGQQDLYRVLKAYSILKPKIGYCQGQAPLASVLLMVMPAEHAFWSLVNLCDLYLEGYFAPGLETLQLHGDMLFALLRKFAPSAHKLLKKQKIEPVLYMTEWFMCLFSRTLPWPAVLRVWDMFMCEGIIVIFKVALVLLGTVLFHEKKSCTSMYETLQMLKNIPKKYMEERSLIPKITNLELTESDLKREHAIQSNCRRIKKIQEAKKKRIESLLEKKQEAEHHQQHRHHQQQPQQQQQHQHSQQQQQQHPHQHQSQVKKQQKEPVLPPATSVGRDQRHFSSSSSSFRTRSSYSRDAHSTYNGNGHKKLTSSHSPSSGTAVDGKSSSRTETRNYYSREPLARLDSHISHANNNSKGRSGRSR